MPRFAANLHYLFNEHPFLERFGAAKAAGFQAVEFQVPYDWPAEQLAALLERHELQMVLLDTPPGNWEAGERGLTALPGREAEFRQGLERTVEYCRALRCDTVHVIAGVLPPGTDRGAAESTYIANLRLAAERLGEHGIKAVIEPINPGLDVIRGGETYTTLGMKGFFLNRTRDAVHYIEEVGSPNLLLHLDFYHMQLTEGHLADTVRQCFDLIRHLQIAGVPGRHEPSKNEINYPYLFDLLDELGYAGWVGCEYRPAKGTLEGLAWAAPYGIGPKTAGGRLRPPPST
jgi:hydroxypyruvate isomerase